MSFVLSAMIIAVLFNMSFVYGWTYFNMRSVLEVVVFIWGLVALRRSTVKDSAVMMVLGMLFALVLKVSVQFFPG